VSRKQIYIDYREGRQWQGYPRNNGGLVGLQGGQCRYSDDEYGQVESGKYTAIETQPTGYSKRVSEYYNDDAGTDSSDVDKVVADFINVALKAVEATGENCL
jgi:hypothetical protein